MDGSVKSKLSTVKWPKVIVIDKCGLFDFLRNIISPLSAWFWVLPCMNILCNSLQFHNILSMNLDALSGRRGI